MDSIKIKNDFDLFLVSPLLIKAGKKKDFILNLNKYRSAHFRTLSDAKKNYNDYIAKLNLNTGDEGFPFKKPVRFHYFYYPKSNRSYDRMNVLSIVDKFLCDALIKEKILIDDNYKLVLTPAFYHAKVDRINPRMEVYIKEEKWKKIK